MKKLVKVAILILFFLDAIREMQKYSSEEQLQQQKGMSHLDTQMQMVRKEVVRV